MSIRTLVVVLFALCLLPQAPRGGADGEAPSNAKARLEAASKVYRILSQSRSQAPLDGEKLYWWSRRWMEAQQDLSEKKVDRVAAVQGHLDRMKKMEDVVRELYRNKFVSVVEMTAQEFYRLEAEGWLARAKAK
jgi:hypothetical protein